MFVECTKGSEEMLRAYIVLGKQLFGGQWIVLCLVRVVVLYFEQFEKWVIA